jgi:hypothetical protein
LIRAFRLEVDSAAEDASIAVSSAVARIQLWYRLNGALALEPPASGFVISAWPQHLITARHAVTPRAGGAAVSLDIAFGEPEERTEGRALSLAYPEDDDPTHDVAVAYLASPISGPLLEVAGDVPDDGTQADAEIFGRPGAELVRVATRVARDRDWLTYVGAGGVPGMSGGPLTSAAGLLGVHVRERAALLANFVETLDACMNAALREATTPNPAAYRSPQNSRGPDA